MKKNLATILVTLLAVVAAASVTAQKKDDKPWTDWSKKDAEKILSDSPWAKVQTDTDTSQMFYSPTQDPQRMGRTSNDGSRLAQGATNQAVNVAFQVRFFSARPVRQALARIMEINNKPPADVVAKLHQFAELQSTNSIIVTVTFDSSDQRYTGVVIQQFNSAATGSLKNDAYLQRSDGKQLFLEEYVPPGKDGFGARFIFLREVDGEPFIKDPNGELRFYAKYPNGIKIDRRFKLAEMMYQGQLEL
jgi:hypothetical protein